VGSPVIRIIFFATAIITLTAQSQAILAVAGHWKLLWGFAITFTVLWIFGPLRERWPDGSVAALAPPVARHR